jgi:hypothetical protein
MNDNKSFVKFGGLAGIVLAITSWVSVVEYFILVPAAQQLPIRDVDAYLTSLAQTRIGTYAFNGLYGLIAFWALFGIVAMYYRLCTVNEGWAFFATLVGVVASIGTLANAVYQVAQLRYIAIMAVSANLAFARAEFLLPSPINPFGIMSFGLTGLWFLIAAVLMLRTNFPKLLSYLGLIAFADLAVGFIGSIAGIGLVGTIAALIAGAVGGPIFWLWLGVILRREA